jgi:PPOX class probable F420-dependent enzyme
VAVTLNEATRKLLDGKNFATVATLGPDGAPQTSVVWIAREGDAAIFTMTTDKQKARNLARDPRISVTVFDSGNGYNSTEIRGTAELVPDPEKSLSKALSHKYLGQDPEPEPAETLRYIVRITPEKVLNFSA